MQSAFFKSPLGQIEKDRIQIQDKPLEGQYSDEKYSLEVFPNQKNFQLETNDHIHQNSTQKLNLQSFEELQKQQQMINLRNISSHTGQKEYNDTLKIINIIHEEIKQHLNARKSKNKIKSCPNLHIINAFNNGNINASDQKIVNEGNSQILDVITLNQISEDNLNQNKKVIPCSNDLFKKRLSHGRSINFFQLGGEYNINNQNLFQLCFHQQSQGSQQFETMFQPKQQKNDLQEVQQNVGNSIKITLAQPFAQQSIKIKNDDQNTEQTNPINNQLSYTLNVQKALSLQASQINFTILNDQDCDEDKNVFSPQGRSSFPNKQILDLRLIPRGNALLETSIISQKQNENGVKLASSQVDLTLSAKNIKSAEEIKLFNLENKLELKDPKISDIAIAILSKNGRSTHEIKFLQKCIEGLPLFQKHQGLFEKSNTSHYIFSQIKHVKFKKNHMIFNYGEYGYHYYIVLKGSVCCLIPHNEFKDDLVRKQKKIEEMEQRLKHLQGNTKVCELQDEGKRFVDIVKLSLKQNEPKLNPSLQNNIDSKQSPTLNPNLADQHKSAEPIQQSLTPLSQLNIDTLKQNNLFISFLLNKGIKLKSTTDRQHLVGRKSDLFGPNSNKQLRENFQKYQQKQNLLTNPNHETQNLSIQQQNDQSSLQSIQIKVPSQEKTENQQQDDKYNYSVEKKENNQVRNKVQTPIQNSDRSNIEDHMLSNETQKQYFTRIFPEFFMVKLFQAGECFGEIALMTKERRTATMVCQEDTHLMVLSKEGFDKIIDSLPTSQLMSLLHYFKIQNYPQKTVIYNDGDKVTDIYFIKSGEVEVLKSLIVEDEAYQQNKREPDSTNKLYEMNSTLKYKIKSKNKEMASIKLLGPGQCFGEDEIIEDQEKRAYKIIVTQHAEIYNIPKDFVMASLKSQKGYNILQKQKELKQRWIQVRETFITEKKAENNNKIKEELQMLQNKNQQKINYNSMQQGMRQKQISLMSDSLQQESHFQSSSSISSPKRNNPFSRQQSIQVEKIRKKDYKSEQQHSISSPKCQQYPILDQLIAEDGSYSSSIDNSLLSKAYSPQKSIARNQEQSNLDQIQSPLTRFESKRQPTMQELKDNFRNNNLILSQSSTFTKQADTTFIKNLPNISLFDYKLSQSSFSFKSHQQDVELQEMTTRSKADNYTILIKNKNQIVNGMNKQVNKEDIKIDLFKDIRKRKQLSSTNTVQIPQKKTNLFNNTQDSFLSQQSKFKGFTHRNTIQCNDEQVQYDKEQIQFNKDQIQYNKDQVQYNQDQVYTKADQSQLRLQNKRSMKYIFFNTNSSFNLSKQIPQSDTLLQNSAELVQKETACKNQSNSGYSILNMNPLPIKIVHSSQYQQVHLKKGSVVNLKSQQQTSHFVAQKHITEFTKDIRKEQNKNSYQIDKKRQYHSVQPIRNAFLSQIDFTEISSDQNAISSQSDYLNPDDFTQPILQQSHYNTVETQLQQNTTNSKIQSQNFKRQKMNLFNSTCNPFHNNVDSNYILSQRITNINQEKDLESLKIFPNESKFIRSEQPVEMNVVVNNEQTEQPFRNKIECKTRNRISIIKDKINFNVHCSSQNYAFSTLFRHDEARGSSKDIRENRIKNQAHNKNQSINLNIVANRYNDDCSSTEYNIQNNEGNKQLDNTNSIQNTVNELHNQPSPNLEQMQVDIKKSLITYRHIDKGMKRIFNLQKLVQNEAEKSFTTKLANLNSQNKINSPHYQIDNQNSSKIQNSQQANTNLSHSNLFQQLSKAKDKHNLRLINICIQKKKINQSLLPPKSNIFTLESSSSQILQRKVFTKVQNILSNEMNQLSQNIHKDLQCLPIQRYNPS